METIRNDVPTETIHTLKVYGVRFYNLVSSFFTATTILWCLNVFAGAIEKVYSLGYRFGILYRSRLRQYIIRLIAGIILLSILLYEIGEKIYLNRREILSTLNQYRNAVGYYFTYS